MKKLISIAALALCASAPCAFASHATATNTQDVAEISKLAQSLDKMSPQSKTEFLVLLKNTNPSVYSVLTYQTLEKSIASNKKLMQQILSNQQVLIQQAAGK